MAHCEQVTALEELCRMEWVSGLHHIPTCSWCGNMRQHGHKESCHLGRAIELLEAVRQQQGGADNITATSTQM